MRLVFLACGLLLALAGNARADAVDDFVTAEMERLKIPGLTLAIVRDGHVLKAQGYGFANLEHRVPAKRETVYHSGSIAKQFTAAAVMLLAQEGRIDLDAPISRYLSGVPPTWQRITVRNLLNHNGGIWDKSFYNGIVDMRKDMTDDEILRAAFTLDPITEPGYSFGYANVGYVVLGILATKVSGMFYGDFLAQRVFTPAGMPTARIISESDIIPNRASGYRLVDGALRFPSTDSAGSSTASPAIAARGTRARGRDSAHATSAIPTTGSASSCLPTSAIRTR